MYMSEHCLSPSILCPNALLSFSLCRSISISPGLRNLLLKITSCEATSHWGHVSGGSTPSPRLLPRSSQYQTGRLGLRPMTASLLGKPTNQRRAERVRRGQSADLRLGIRRWGAANPRDEIRIYFWKVERKPHQFSFLKHFNASILRPCIGLSHKHFDISQGLQRHPLPICAGTRFWPLFDVCGRRRRKWEGIWSLGRREGGWREQPHSHPLDIWPHHGGVLHAQGWVKTTHFILGSSEESPNFRSEQWVYVAVRSSTNSSLECRWFHLELITLLWVLIYYCFGYGMESTT